MKIDEQTYIQEVIKASTDSFRLGKNDERDRILDIIAEQLCNHPKCDKCDAYQYLIERITA